MNETQWTNSDRDFMARAIRLARKGLGSVEPNPAVGAVLVKNNQIIGQGYHHYYGGPHAEVDALKNARTHGHKTRNATLYVTLEPCCHWGKTPPCTEAVIAAGIKKVIAATRDPSKKVAGKGLRALARAGIDVRVGLLADEAQKLNPWFFKFHRHHRPWVIAKWAQTLDGKLAAATGHSQWISGPPARQVAHRLRRSCQAILVGVRTVLADNPQLTVRLETKIKGKFTPPNRVVLDPHLRTPISSQLVQTARLIPTWVIASKKADPARIARLKDRGVNVVLLPVTAAGRIQLPEFLEFAAAQNWPRILVEGGANILSSFLLEGHIDEMVVFQTALLALDKNAVQFQGNPTRKVSDFISDFTLQDVSLAGKDAVLTYLLK